MQTTQIQVHTWGEVWQGDRKIASKLADAVPDEARPDSVLISSVEPQHLAEFFWLSEDGEVVLYMRFGCEAHPVDNWPVERAVKKWVANYPELRAFYKHMLRAYLEIGAWIMGDA